MQLAMLDFKHIHIGNHIKNIVEIREIPLTKICSYFESSQQGVIDMYNMETMDSGLLLKWSKLLEYNLFMIYHSHLQLYVPKASVTKLKGSKPSESVGQYTFRKNLYSPEIIEWILRKLESNELSIKDIIIKYNIPRTTLYRWKRKYISFN